jgi:hypothetical protein
MSTVDLRAPTLTAATSGSESMSVLVTAAQVMVLVSVALFVLAFVHKRRQAQHAGMASAPILRFVLRSSATGASVALAGVELGLAGLLIVWPMIGLAITAALLLAYAAALRTLRPDEECGCFGEIIPMTNRLAVRRNLLLASAAFGGSAVGTTHDLSRHLMTQLTAGLALVVLAIITGWAHAARAQTAPQSEIEGTGAADALQ